MPVTHIRISSGSGVLEDLQRGNEPFWVSQETAPLIGEERQVNILMGDPPGSKGTVSWRGSGLVRKG